MHGVVQTRREQKITIELETWSSPVSLARQLSGVVKLRSGFIGGKRKWEGKYWKEL